MFLSLLPLKSDATPHQIHAGLDALYGWSPEVGDRPYLWALVPTGVLSRSKTPPVIGGAQTRREGTPVGEEPFMFEVTLNPVRRSDKGERPILVEAEVKAWAQNLLQNSGLTLECLEDLEAPALWASRISSAPLVKPGRGDSVPLFLWRVRFLARISDAQKFERAWTSGVGRKKRYGAGMLLLARV